MSLNNLKKRIEYRGGGRQVDRMIEDKQRSLNKALLYSYQSATAILNDKDKREFRCLINPNKLTMELDDKMLSIPFEDICLNKARQEGETTSQGKEPIGVKVGDIITWKENNTHWIIYSQYLQETAYFRGLMRQCESEALEIDGQKYWYYLKGPDEKGIDWQKTKHFIFNNLNYSLEIYISNTTATKQLFHRHSKVKLPFKNNDGKIEFRPYETQAVDDITTPGILAVYLKEDYTNKWEQEEAPSLPPEAILPGNTVRIDGPLKVYPYDIVEYRILNAKGGAWSLSNNRARILNQSESSVKVEITTGKRGSVDLIYNAKDIDNVVQNIEILSL